MSHNDTGSDKSSDHIYDSLVKRITGAFTLITLGIFLLLNSTNVIPWSSWMTVLLIFIRIWPIFIIIAGLQLMFNKSSFVRIILDILSSLVFVFVLLVAAYVNTTNSTLKSQLEKNIPIFELLKVNIDSPDYTQLNLSSTQTDFPLEDVKQREINLDFTNEQFNISVDKTLNDYLFLDANYHSNISQPFLDSKLNENKLVIDTGVKYLSKLNFLAFNASPKYKYVIGQNEIPTSMNIEMTSGTGELDLTDLNIDELRMKETSGNLLADLSATNIKSVKLEMTSGNSTLIFSKESHIEIIFDKTSGNLIFNGESTDKKVGRISLGDTSSDNVIEVDLQLTSGNMIINTK